MHAVDASLQPEAREISGLSALLTVARTCGPHLVEATIIPAVLFYACLVGVGLDAAYLAALAWSYSALCCRRLCRRPIPPLLVLGVIGITLRTLLAVLSGSTFIYFLQPVLGTVGMGIAFLVSVAMGRPIVGKLAAEFWPIAPEVASRPPIRALFRRLTVLWAGVHMASAAMTLALLLCLPLATFVALKQVCGLGLTGVGIALTIALSRRTARREGLATSRPRLRLVPAVTDPGVPVWSASLALDEVGAAPRWAVAASS